MLRKKSWIYKKNHWISDDFCINYQIIIFMIKLSLSVICLKLQECLYGWNNINFVWILFICDVFLFLLFVPPSLLKACLIFQIWYENLFLPGAQLLRGSDDFAFSQKTESQTVVCKKIFTVLVVAICISGDEMPVSLLPWGLLLHQQLTICN